MICVRAGVAPGQVIGADHRHAGELALRSGHRRQRHAAHAGDGLEHLLQVEEAFEKALGMAPPAPAGGDREIPAASRACSTARGLYFIVHEPSG